VTTANLQWRGLVEACISSGVAQQIRIVPVCDVSGSMAGRPMEVAVALSLLLAESAPLDSPWHGKIFTFSEVPHLVTVPPGFQLILDPVLDMRRRMGRRALA
jgi:hypothetical protein